MISVRASFVQAGDRLIAEASAQQIVLPMRSPAEVPQTTS
jgi:hypothetical protein